MPLVLVLREVSTSCSIACAADETKPFWSCTCPSAKRNSGNFLGPLWALNKDISAASHRLLTGLRLPLQCRPLFCWGNKTIRNRGFVSFKPIWFSIITRISHFQEIGCVTSRLLHSLRSLLSKRFCLVSEQRKTKEGNSLLFHLRHFSRFLWLLSLVVCSETKRKRWLRRLIAGQPPPSPCRRLPIDSRLWVFRSIFSFFRN